ncbi:hypothetical protein L6164_027689 [Bauhinia variegata]|uniref:Uncharacterized protein n=1 Tax=Bauhinia variegata TaxID=167791 RepID=A0ACB9LTX9_BAUVA|nr:hypothetical protein L6164_027689 [Bauhinia variegata]
MEERIDGVHVPTVSYKTGTPLCNISNMDLFSSSSAENNLATAKTVLSAVAAVQLGPPKGLFSSFSSFRSASSWFELYAAFSTFMMLFRTAINDLVPHQLRSLIVSKLKSLFSDRQSNSLVRLEIDHYWDGQSNLLYHASKEYLPARITHTYKSLKLGILGKHKNVFLAIDDKQEVVDEFEGVKLRWKLTVKDQNSKSFDNVVNDSFTLSFHEKHREIVMSRYIPHVLRTHEAMKAERRIVKIHSLNSSRWKKSDLAHPATFDTLALDPELRQSIIDDLERFLKRKELYKKVGKPWKRGYLFYGPPGTGKSSLIAAMANYLKFDIYDLELTRVSSNSDLMRAMSDTANRSIIVIEDIDCNKEVHSRSKTSEDSDFDPDSDSESIPKTAKVRKRFTLSGLLNYMDGLWSSCGEERIIIFTTNHVEKIDPALLRPGRMDMHINLSFCKPKAFRILASNYLDVQGQHPLFEEIEGILEKTEVTPAILAEQLLRNEDPDVALAEVLKFLREKETETKQKESTRAIVEK